MSAPLPDLAPGPVLIEHRRDHEFEDPGTGGKAPRCQRCGRGKKHLLHLGAPLSLNVAGSGGNHFAYQAAKSAWQNRLHDLINDTGLPAGLARIVVEAEVCFPDRRRRDQGNFRYMLEKALGDALVAGGWIEKDTWTHYSFGGLERREDGGANRTRLTLFPTALAQQNSPDTTLFASTAA